MWCAPRSLCRKKVALCRAIRPQLAASLAEPGLESDHMLINIGPQHPATHGVLRLVLELDGETVVRCIPHIGYLHCGFEKIGEYRQYNQIIPWTDREDYLNSMGNNVSFVMGCERLFGIEITPRCTVLRVIAMELSRIMSHVVWVGTTAVDIGAFTPFLWIFQERENIYNLLEGWVGARLTTTGTRVGGMAADIPDGWVEGLKSFVKGFYKTLDETDKMLTKNAIWSGRTVGLGVLSPPDAINAGMSGPMLRASGVAYDVRKDFPYLDYETYDFRCTRWPSWRCVRSLSRAHGRNASVVPHSRAGHPAFAGRTRQR